MKKLLFLSLFMAFFSLVTTAQVSFAQDSDTATRPANPGDDPNEAMTPQGAGVPNYGCSDPSKSCLARLKHGRLGDDTTFRPSSAANGSSGAVGTPTEGTR